MNEKQKNILAFMNKHYDAKGKTNGLTYTLYKVLEECLYVDSVIYEEFKLLSEEEKLAVIQLFVSEVTIPMKQSTNQTTNEMRPTMR